MSSADNPVLFAKTRISANGRIVIPAAIREQLGVKPGETILMDVEDGVLKIETYPTRIARIQREFARLIPPGVSLADELIADRREEVRREQEKADREQEEIEREKREKIA
jgi:AbrB family looped-hinge helix DNA binding protein